MPRLRHVRAENERSIAYYGARFLFRAFTINNALVILQTARDRSTTSKRESIEELRK